MLSSAFARRTCCCDPERGREPAARDGRDRRGRGPDIYLDVNMAGASMTARVEPTARVEVGQQVSLYPDPERIHLFDQKTGISLLS